MLLLPLLMACASKQKTEAPPPDKAAHDHSGHHQHRFDDAEKWAQRFDDPARDAWQKPQEVVELLEMTAGMTVVDLGAGTGYFLPYLSAAVGPEGKVIALDVEQAMVDYMVRRAEKEGLTNVEARKVPFDDPQLEAGAIDRIIIVNTWHHIAERAAYAKKLRAALKPDGQLFIVDWTRDSPEGPPKAFRIPPKFVIKTLGLAGLEGSTVEETLPNQWIVRATVKTE